MPEPASGQSAGKRPWLAKRLTEQEEQCIRDVCYRPEHVAWASIMTAAEHERKPGGGPGCCTSEAV